MTEKLKIEENYTHSDIWFNHVLVNNDGEYVGGVDSDYMSHAHLFAASLLMLEALERMIKYIEAGAGATAEVEYGAVLNQARAAIAAAKGEWRNEINVQSTKFESSGVLSVGDEIVLPKRGE